MELCAGSYGVKPFPSNSWSIKYAPSWNAPVCRQTSHPPFAFKKAILIIDVYWRPKCQYYRECKPSLDWDRPNSALSITKQTVQAYCHLSEGIFITKSFFLIYWHIIIISNNIHPWKFKSSGFLVGLNRLNAISSVNKAIYENAQYPLIFNFQTEYQN